MSEAEVKQFTVGELRKCKEAIEKMRTARTEQHLEPVFVSIAQLVLMIDTFSHHEDSARKFFFSDLVVSSVNYLINYKAYPPQQAVQVESYLKRLLKFIVDQEDHIKLAEVFRMVFDPARMFYQHNFLEKTLNDFVFNSFEVVKMPIYEAKEGLVDCLKQDKFTFLWSRAELQFRGTNDSSVRYLNTPHQEAIVSNTREIMPYQSRTTPYYDLMLKLQPGDQVDFCDSNGNWVLANINERRETADKETIVEYRISAEDSSYLNATSPRLAPAKLHSSRECPDSSDLVFSEEYSSHRFWALLRLKQNKCHAFIRIVNYFGSIGGFEEILKRLGDEQKWWPIEIMSNFLSGLGYASAQLSRQFSDEYVPQLKQLVMKNLLSSPEANVRNMGKDRLDLVMKGMESLLRKVVTAQEKLRWNEQITLELVIMCFKSQFLDKKIQSLKYLVDVTRSVISNTFKTVTLTELWIKTQQIFEQLFSPNAHLQLITRSTDLLRLLINTENALSTEHLEILWELMKTEDPELKPIIYKVINDVAITLKDNHIAFFQDKIAQVPIDQLSLEQIQVLYEINRLQTKNQELLAQAIKIFWQITQYKSENQKQTKLPKDLVKKARSFLCTLFKNLECRTKKMEIINLLLQNISQQRAVGSSLKTLSSILSSFPPRESETDNFSLQVVLTELIDERHIIETLISSVVSFRASAATKRQGQPLTPELTKSYLNQLTERIHALKTLIKLSDRRTIVTLNFLNTMWSELVLKSQCKEESDIMCSWLSDLIEKDKSEDFFFILESFFRENFISDQFAAAMNAQGFQCFQVLMLKLNERAGLLMNTEPATITSAPTGTGITTTYNSAGQVVAISNTGPIGGGTQAKATQSAGDFTEEVRKQQDYLLYQSEFKYKTKVEPEKLVGMEFLWSVVYRNENGPVVESAICLLTQLYLNVSLEDERKSIRTGLIERVLSRIYQDHTNKENPQFKSSVIRSLFILRNLLNESEREGIGSLRSLSGLVKGDLLQLSITNDLTTGQVR